MARNSYKMHFKDKTIVYSNVHSSDTPYMENPYRVLSEEQMELMNLMLMDSPEPSFSCTEEEFYNRLTPKMLEGYRELKSNVFKLNTE